jgi:hypothetical protein
MDSVPYTPSGTFDVQSLKFKVVKPQMAQFIACHTKQAVVRRRVAVSLW